MPVASITLSSRTMESAFGMAIGLCSERKYASFLAAVRCTDRKGRWLCETADSTQVLAPYRTDARAAQITLLHDIVGPLPFRPVSLNRTWLTLDVVMMSQAIYEERTFDRLPALADALEAAGCRDAEVLRHLREPGTHVRGCWALDAVLGKS
jgi:hypothetical protein